MGPTKVGVLFAVLVALLLLLIILNVLGVIGEVHIIDDNDLQFVNTTTEQQQQQTVSSNYSFYNILTTSIKNDIFNATTTSEN